MKLIYTDNGTIVGASEQEFSSPDSFIDAPEGVTIENFTNYCVTFAEDGTPSVVLKPVLTVTRRQGRQALLLAGLLDQVQPAIDAIVDDMERGMAQIYWDDAQDFERNNQTLLALAEALGLTESDVDDLFLQASQL